MSQPVFQRSILSALLLGVGTVCAQTLAVQPAGDGNTASLGNIQVTAKNRSTRTENRDSYTTSAMRTTTGLALSPKETPQSVSVITQTQLDDQGIRTMEEALKTTTGVNVIADSGRWRYQSRGFYINRIEEDGVATTVTAGASGNPYRDAQSMTDLAVYDHIEVVRGATGLTQGNGQPGGTINAVRKRPTAARQADGNIQIDRFGSLRGDIDVSGSLNEARTLRGRVVGTLESQRSFKDGVKGHGGLLYGVLEADVGEQTRLTFGGLFQDKTEMPDYFGVPMGENGRESGLPRDTYLGFDWNRTEFRKINLFADAEHYFNDDWKLNARLNYINSRADSRFGAITNLSTAYTGLPAGGTLAVNNLQRYENRGYQAAFSLNLNGKYDLLGQRHDLFAGYSFAREHTDTAWRRVRNSTRFDPFKFKGNEVAQPDWDADFDDRVFYDARIQNHGLMLGTRFNFSDRWHVIAGTRWTRWKSASGTYYDIWNKRPDSDPDVLSSAKRSRFVPYLGLTYDINPQHSLYASYTSIFEPQSSTDFHGRVLPPMIGNNYEIGWKAAFADEKLNASVALFHVEQTNRAVSMTDPATNRSYFEPSGKVVSRGLDAEISGQLTPNWQLFAGYTFNNSQYKETENSTRLAGMNFSKHTPRHMLRLYTSYRLPVADGKWRIGGGLSVQSKTASFYDVEQGGYALLNANVQYRPNRHLTLSLIGNNLTDRRYYQNHRVRTLGGNNFYGEPRNVTFKLNWKL